MTGLDEYNRRTERQVSYVEYRKFKCFVLHVTMPYRIMPKPLPLVLL